MLNSFAYVFYVSNGFVNNLQALYLFRWLFVYVDNFLDSIPRFWKIIFVF